MSDEEIRFKRSQGGHDANDLHNHGGQDDAREDKTEREDLEEEIEALDEAEASVEVKQAKKIDVFDDDVEVPVDPAEIEPEVDPEDPIEEKKIAEAKKEETEKAEEAIEEALKEDAKMEENNWKEKTENQAYMKIDSVEEPKAKTGKGWKIATIVFALLALAGCGAAAYLFLFDGTTNFLGREVTSKVEGSKTPEAPTTPEKPDDTPIATQFDFDAKKIDYASFKKIFSAKKEEATPLKVDITKDGKYYYIIADVNELDSPIGGYAGVWYRETTKGAAWTQLQTGQDLGDCKNYSQNQITFMQTYNYIDDDLSSRYVGCAGMSNQSANAGSAQFDYAAYAIDYAGFTKIFTAKKQEATPIKIDITKDGKYYYIIADVDEIGAIGGYAGVWYREAKSGATWTELQSGQDLSSCKNYTQGQTSFMQTYDYIDDDLDSKYVGCANN